MPTTSRSNLQESVPLKILFVTLLAAGTFGCATEPSLIIVPDYGQPLDLAFSPDDRLWATLEGGRVQSWDLPSGEPGPFFQDDHAFWRIAISPNGKYAALTHGTSVQVRDLDTHERLALLEELPAGISSLRFSPDDRLLVGTCAYGSIGTREGIYETGLNPVFVWKVPGGELVRRFDEHTEPVQDAVFSPDARSVFSAGSEAVGGWTHMIVYQWHVATGEIAACFKGPRGEPVGIDITPDSRKLVSGSSDGRLVVWETGKPQPVQNDQVASASWDMALTPDGRLAALASGATTTIPPIPFIWNVWPSVPTLDLDNKVYLYNVQTGRHKRELGGHAGVVLKVAASPDGRYIASLDTIGHIRIYRLKQEDEVE